MGRSIDFTSFSEIPLFKRPFTVEFLGESGWAHRYRVDIGDDSSERQSYFLKISFGEQGKRALMGEFESTSELHAIVGDFSPKPLAWGSFKGINDAHYYICEYFELDEKVPEPVEFCKTLAELHRTSVSPNGKFGFHCITYNGDLPQANGYTDTWEEFFTRGLEHILKLNIERGGPWEEMEALKPALMSKIVPRLLRPMETGGRSVKPSLVHGDLWCGNTAVNVQTGRPLIYDPSSFYAHHEYELGNWRPARNRFETKYIETYKRYNTESYPKNDFDDRNALYSIRFNAHAAALFPEQKYFRNEVIDEMKRLIAKFPEGYKENTRDLGEI